MLKPPPSYSLPRFHTELKRERRVNNTPLAIPPKTALYRRFVSFQVRGYSKFSLHSRAYALLHNGLRP